MPRSLRVNNQRIMLCTEEEVQARCRNGKPHDSVFWTIPTGTGRWFWITKQGLPHDAALDALGYESYGSPPYPTDQKHIAWWYGRRHGKIVNRALAIRGGALNVHTAVQVELGSLLVQALRDAEPDNDHALRTWSLDTDTM